MTSNPEYEQQLGKLIEMRNVMGNQSQAPSAGSPESDSALFTDDDEWLSGVEETAPAEEQPDPPFENGLYAPSGIDMLGILIRVQQRPNPQIKVGNIDSETALVLCDSTLPDNPIVYWSDAFETLTGYSGPEIQGQNCRFLQHRFPTSGNKERDEEEEAVTNGVNAEARRELRERLKKGDEAQVLLINFTKSGERFENILTTVPIYWDEGGKGGKMYIVGFQASRYAVS